MKKNLNVPMVLQMENVECGAASLSMVLKYFGNMEISLEQLRVDCNVTRDGVNAKGIKRAAIKNGLKCSAFKATPQNITNVSLPAILHWNMGHFVVLTGFGKNCFYINDPALGKITVDYDQFDRSFTGIVLCFEKGENFKENKVEKKHRGFTVTRVKPFMPWLVFISFLIMIVTFLNMLMPFFSSAYIDYLLLEGNISVFKTVILSIITVILFSFFASVLYTELTQIIERKINISLSVGFMSKILKLPVVFFAQRTPGELANRQLGSFESASMVCKYIAPVIFQVVLIAVYCIAAFIFDIYTALIGVFAIVFNILIAFLESKEMTSISALNKKNSGLYQASVASSVDMIETIKSCACEKPMFSRIAGSGAQCVQTETAREKLKIYSSSAFYFINNMVSALILISGVYEILDGRLSVGIVVGILGMASAFLIPIGSFINSISAIFQLKSTADRTDDTMKYAEDDIFLNDEGEQLHTMDGSIRYDDVSFSYGNNNTYALKNISFELNKGGSVAFVGGSGSGKSTAAKLVAGLYNESLGNIYYGSAKKNELKKSYFYSKLAVVSQNVKMYEGTIFDNVTMWDSDIAYEQVVLACKVACIHQEIVKRPSAYYEYITEGGKNFSGGQRQRLEIARAIVRNPQILILDEATSALDAQTERIVMENIKALGITLIIIAHRLSTIRDCDEILVFKEGEVVERGNHNSLYAQKGMYYELVADKGE